LLLSSAIETIEISLVSRIAATTIFISWAIIIVIVVCVNWNEISSVNIVVSNRFHKLITIISLVCNITGIMYFLRS
jgi:hypothetical protein